MGIYTIIIKNRKTGREISKDYDLKRLLQNPEWTVNTIIDMKHLLEDKNIKF